MPLTPPGPGAEPDPDTDPGAELQLGELQLEVMQVLWRSPEASAAGVAAALAPERPLAQTTVATVLARLARRGLVASRRDGRQLLYRAAASEAAVRRGMVGSLLRRLFGGRPEALLAHLVSEREIAAGDLARVEALLARHGATGADDSTPPEQGS